MPSCWVHRAGSGTMSASTPAGRTACRSCGARSGGGTVVVGPGALNVTVILPESAAPGLAAVDEAQRYVLDWIARSIRGAGPPVTLAAGATWCWRPQVRRQCPAAAQALVHGPLLDPLRFSASSGSSATWRFPVASRNIGRGGTTTTS